MSLLSQAAQVVPAREPTGPLAREEEITIYEDDAVALLPVVNISRTVGAKLCGRLDDVDFNAMIISTTLRLQRWLQIISAVSIASILSLYFIADVPTRTAMSYLSAATGAVVILFNVASLSWDMMCLISSTFEFWFLLVITTADATLWCVLFHDERVAAFVVTGIQFVLMLCVDANIYTRLVVIRSLVFSSPALVAGLVLTTLHYPPDLHYPTYQIFGVAVDAVDLLVNGNLILAYFTTFRAYRSKHVVFSTAPINWITCDVYFPVCHLVPQAQRLLAEEARRRISTVRNLGKRHDTNAKALKLLEDKTAHGINGRDLLFPLVARLVHQHFSAYILTTIGALGLASWLLAFSWTLVEIRHAHSPMNPAPYYLAAVGIACTSLFVAIHFAHLQRKLLGRILTEIDAWFISFELSAATFGACDLMNWDTHRVLLVLTAWIWGHWALFLDAASPFSRRRLALTHRFVLLVDTMLVVYPLLIVHWLYFSHDRPTLHNRVLLEVSFGVESMRVEMLGFVGGKIFTLWIWMGRFFWRELLRPADAFKLIKRRVFYRVNV